MSFVELFGGDVDEPDPPPEPAFHERPAWLGPPDGELGVPVPLARILARSEHAVVALSHAVAYSNGVALELVARVDGLTPAQATRIFHEQHLPRIDLDELPEAFLRFGIELPGGARVSNLGGRPSARPDDAPSRPVLLQQGGGGGMSSATSVSMKPGFWLWPLPEAGTLRIVCEWPVADIAVTDAAVETTALREAAAMVVQLWDGETAAVGAPWTSATAQYAVATLVEPAETVEVPVAELRSLEQALRRLRRGRRSDEE